MAITWPSGATHCTPITHFVGPQLTVSYNLDLPYNAWKTRPSTLIKCFVSDVLNGQQPIGLDHCYLSWFSHMEMVSAYHINLQFFAGYAPSDPTRWVAVLFRSVKTDVGDNWDQPFV